MIDFALNGKSVSVNTAEDKPLLWVLREDLSLTGTKFGCGITQCGACTVHIEEQPIRSCVLPIAATQNMRVTTIEGSMQTEKGKALENAWIREQVPQCGYCQSGQLMSAASILENTKGSLTREAVLDSVAGNLCRCSTYNYVATAIVNTQKTIA